MSWEPNGYFNFSLDASAILDTFYSIRPSHWQLFQCLSLYEFHSHSFNNDAVTKDDVDVNK